MQIRKPLFVALLTFSAAALAGHDADDRRLNDYALTFASPSSNQIVQMDGPLHRTSGSPAEISERAKACMLRYVHDEAGSPTTLSGILGNRGVHSSSADGSPIESDDPDNGTVTIHSRAQFRHLFLAYESRSRMTLDVKDSDFRIVQTDLSYRQLDTGGSPQEFGPIQKLALSGWDGALEALQEVSDQVASCIESAGTPPSAD